MNSYKKMLSQELTNAQYGQLQKVLDGFLPLEEVKNKAVRIAVLSLRLQEGIKNEVKTDFDTDDLPTEEEFYNPEPIYIEESSEGTQELNDITGSVEISSNATEEEIESLINSVQFEEEEELELVDTTTDLNYNQSRVTNSTSEVKYNPLDIFNKTFKSSVNTTTQKVSTPVLESKPVNNSNYYPDDLFCDDVEKSSDNHEDFWDTLDSLQQNVQVTSESEEVQVSQQTMDLSKYTDEQLREYFMNNFPRPSNDSRSFALRYAEWKKLNSII